MRIISLLLLFTFISACEWDRIEPSTKTTHVVDLTDSISFDPKLLKNFPVCHIDSINDVSGEQSLISIMSGSNIKIRGWAVYSIQNDIPASKITMIFFKNNKPVFSNQLIITQRPDVAEYFHKKGLVNSGFDVNYNGAVLNSGYYKIGLLISNDGHQDILCSTFANIKVAN